MLSARDEKKKTGGFSGIGIPTFLDLFSPEQSD
jgi:hypothetical protein